MRVVTLFVGLTLLAMSCFATVTQDATVVAPQHYKVEFENELVRVVRVNYEPHEKSDMHDHAGGPTVIVVLRGGGRMHFVYPDGTTSEGKPEKAGSVRFVPERGHFQHAGENVGDGPIEVVRVELKGIPQSKPCGAQ